jgi:hemerythrin
MFEQIRDNAHLQTWQWRATMRCISTVLQPDRMNAMEAFCWTPSFETGIAEVDEQHHRLVGLINRFGSLLMGEKDVPLAELEAIFAELSDYTQYHFSEEESLMRDMGLTPRYVEEHHQAHQNFLLEVTQLRSAVSSGNLRAARSLLQFLTHWLAYHILGSDRFLAKEIAATKSGAGSTAAYLTHIPTNDPATEALLSALNGMIEQISERNRELVELNRTLEARVMERTQALTEANQCLEDLANTDILSGLPNRRYAMRRFAMEWEASIGKSIPLGCMMIDADNFKIINDTYGHDAGDAVLRGLSTQLQHTVRTDDIVCRLGGDEFLVICPRTALAGTLKLAESIRRKVAELRISAGSGEWKGSVSIGVAAWAPGMNSVEDLLKAADRGVYVAKRNGRNCVGTEGG